MTENLEQYLASDQAVTAVDALLAKIGRSRVHWTDAADWERRSEGTWTEVGVRVDDESVSVYFRHDGKDAATLQERCIVTDLGDATRAFWLLHSDMFHFHPERVSRVPGIIGKVLSVPFYFRCEGHALTLHHVPTADLPRAICALMLAVYKVSRQDMTHG